jgi:hypothetical protein
MKKDFNYLLDVLKGRCSIDEIELIAIVAHNIWFRRNAIVHGGQGRS